MARKKGSTGTPATVALTGAGIDFTVHTYDHDPRAQSFGLEAAEALALEPGQVFKTLLVRADAQLVVGIVPVTGQLDLKALARALGATKCAIAEQLDAERATGYVVGGISPVGQKKAHPTVLDQSALAHAVVYVSGGRRGLDLGLAPGDLVRVTSAVTAPIGRPAPGGR